MKKHFAAAIALVALALAGSSVTAQVGKGKGKPVTGQQVKYFDLSSFVFAELSGEVILKETRQGSTLVSAELEVCHQSPTNSGRLDRFVLPLKVEGNRLTGSGQSQEEKQAVSANFTRRVSGTNLTLEGTLRSGSFTEEVKTSDNAESTLDEITERYLAEDQFDPAPKDFTAASSQSLIVKVGRSGVTGLLNGLRDQNVRVVFNGLITSCGVLRSGNHFVQLDLDADRAGAVLAKVKSLPGVVGAGYSVGEQNLSRAIRFPSAGWRDASGKLERDKLGTVAAEAIAKSMGATVKSSSWDVLLGELTVVVRRADQTVSGFPLVQEVTVKLTTSPEGPTSNQNSIIWIDSVAAQIVEEHSAPRLEFYINVPDQNSEETNEPEGSEALAEAVAGALKGTVWDSENERWPQ